MIVKVEGEYHLDGPVRRSLPPAGLFTLLYRIVTASLLLVLILGCADDMGDAGAMKDVIRSYNALLSQGYSNQNMTPLLRVTTDVQALKLYHHMSALGEGGLRMESVLKDIKFERIDRRGNSEATVETEETWDFTHRRMATNEKYAEEKDFVYRMEYLLSKRGGGWIITRVDTVSGTSTNNLIPWPVPDRKGDRAKLPQKTIGPSGQH